MPKSFVFFSAFLFTLCVGLISTTAHSAWDPLSSLQDLGKTAPGVSRLKTEKIWTSNMIDKAYCANSPKDEDRLCDQSFSSETENKELDAVDAELKSKQVDKKNPESVREYNDLVAKQNRLVKAQNDKIQKNCVVASEYCKPIKCEKEIPRSGYEKDTGKCACPADFTLKDGKCVSTSRWLNFAIFGILGLIALLALMKTFKGLFGEIAWFFRWI